MRLLRYGWSKRAQAAWRIGQEAMAARLSRREMLKLGLLAAGSPLLPAGREAQGQTFGFRPFQVDLPIPGVLRPTQLTPAPGSRQASVGSRAVFHGIAPEFFPDHPTHCPDWNRFPTKHYRIVMRRAVAQIIPGVETEVFGYNGQVPGPTIVTRFREPIVVRQVNRLGVESSVHVHGGHQRAHADGFPNFYVLPGRARDYYYPNIAPREREGCGEPFDISEVPSTMWYHDHGVDLTGFNVSRGLLPDDRQPRGPVDSR